MNQNGFTALVLLVFMVLALMLFVSDALARPAGGFVIVLCLGLLYLASNLQT